ncbi:hypothetical protein Neosp_004289 [[Neocosmospora] mangrovei]
MESQTGATTTPASISEARPVQITLLNPPDDWNGITSSAERRRRQNRINQRAWRQRHRRRPANCSDDASSAQSAATDEADPPQLMVDRAEDLAVPTGPVILAQGYLLLPTTDRRAKARLFASSAYNDYSSGLPQPGYLPALTHLNVLDAMARNAAAIGISIKGLCRDDLISPFNTYGPSAPSAGEIAAACPATLLPTLIQRTIIHHPWIDLIPIPQFRDNVLLAVAAGVMDEDELCADMLSLDDGRGENASLIVWAGSWDLRGWEASVPFLRKWGWRQTNGVTEEGRVDSRSNIWTC